MSEPSRIAVDGNEAAAWIAYLASEVVSIYPITPASPMGELADRWAAAGRENLWGEVPRVIEMQSEAGAAGAVHGALQGGALATTFTASQGLLLMIPEMYKIAGGLLPAVFHVAARTVATEALTIFGEHSDVMATRATGFGLMASGSVQEAMDLALIAHAVTLEARVPIVHFFDGFRTSHELTTITPLDRATVRALIDDEAVGAHRARALSPEHPVLRGSTQNPDVYFQAREAANPYYQRLPRIVQRAMGRFAALTGRQYRLFDYAGAEDAGRVLVVMGSGAEVAQETVEDLVVRGERVGLVKVRLYRPFDPDALLAALPASTRRIAVLDRTKEPGADGEPLYKDIVTALARYRMAGGQRFDGLPHVIGGRYGLASKELDPGMVKAVLDELDRASPRHPFTIGIEDDVGGTSLAWDRSYVTRAAAESETAVFFGLGSDGTVSASKNAVKVIAELTGLHAQGYAEYDSRKAGALTISHLRYGPRPIRSSYLIGEGGAKVVVCNQPMFLERYEVLDKASPGGIFLLNAGTPADAVWDTLPGPVQRAIIEKSLEVYVVDAFAIAAEAGLERRINTVMQACFFAVARLVPGADGQAALKSAAARAYAKAGPEVVQANLTAIDRAVASVQRVPVPDTVTGAPVPAPVPAAAPAFVRELTGELIAGRGAALPVSRMPADGTFPLGTGRWEKRGLADELPVIDYRLCTQCGKCVFVCPHSALRSKVLGADALTEAPAGFAHAPVRSRAMGEGMHIAYQVSPDDCTSCELCVEACPITDPDDPARKAIGMADADFRLDDERENWAFFERLADADPARVKKTAIPSAMTITPLFGCSSACSGCGETPYLRLLSQLFGDRMVVANATGCSSIYGGNLPTTPWSTDAAGRGPAWCNSLFEDNAEFGMGIRVAADGAADRARHLLEGLRETVGKPLADAILEADQSDAAAIAVQRERVVSLLERLAEVEAPEARALEGLAEYLVRRSVWIVGGDGWAYDIGFGGLDHVLASGENLNVLVLDTEVYSNTGGQTSKATPLGAVAKFSAAGKPAPKKDLVSMAIGLGSVYVAQVAFGAKDTQTLRALLEADAYPGVSLVVAYATCIEHGIDMSKGLHQQSLAVQCGHWPLLRFDPRRAERGKPALKLDSGAPSIPFHDYAVTEGRYRRLMRSDPETAERYFAQAETEARRRYERYRALAGETGPRGENSRGARNEPGSGP